MEKVRAVVIGAGYWSRAAHLPALVDNDDVEILALCDVNREAAEETAARFGIGKTYTDYREMIESEKPAAAFVVTGIAATLEVAAATMEAGIPTMLEKPPGRGSAEARKLCEVADRTGTINVLAFNRRHMPVVNRARDLLADRVIRSVTGRILRYRRYEPGFVLGTGIHAIDTMRYLGGDVVEVTTVSAEASEAKGGTNLVSAFRFESGALGVLYLETACGRFGEFYEVHGEDTSLFLRTNQPGMRGLEGGFEFWQGRDYPLKSEGADILEAYRPLGWLEGIRGEQEELIDCIRQDRRSPNDVHDGLKTMLVAEAIARGGHQVVEKP